MLTESAENEKQTKSFKSTSCLNCRPYFNLHEDEKTKSIKFSGIIDTTYIYGGDRQFC